MRGDAPAAPHSPQWQRRAPSRISRSRGSMARLSGASRICYKFSHGYPDPEAGREVMAICALRDKAIVLRPEDAVAIAKAEICVGTRLEDEGGTIEAGQDIP